MRVLVVDQDSASNLAITRSLRELYTVDCVTNKGDCLDLLRSNTYEVIVATERLEDGSGLELLGQISKKWPSVLRIFAAERERLRLLRGRLGPFELFQTLAYPIDPDRLIATLELAEAAQHADADTSAIEQIELSGVGPDDAPAAEEPADFAEEPRDHLEVEEREDFPEARFATRPPPLEQAHAASGGQTLHESWRVSTAISASVSGATSREQRGGSTDRSWFVERQRRCNERFEFARVGFRCAGFSRFRVERR